MKLTPQKKLASERLRQIARALQLHVAASRYGRIVLHALVAIKSGHYLWHSQGIARDFVRP